MKISQNQLAKKIGVTKGYMSKIVKGKYIKPGNRVIAGLLHLTKLPFEELFVVVHDPQPNMVAENLPSYSPIYPREKSSLLIITKEVPLMKLHNRQIKASFWVDTDMIRNFTLEERLFYIGLWQLADDSGCVENDPYAFKLFLFPLNEEVTIETLVSWTQKLIEKQKLISYHTQGKDGLFLTNFHKHQTIKNPQPPEVPLPPWITWKPYKSNPRTGRYEIDDPQDHQEIHHPQEIQCPHETADDQYLQVSLKTKIHKTFKTWKLFQESQDLFYLLTLFLHLAYKINIKRI
jgi:transcriptional regulator with XRE-family HTH domain